MRDNRVYIRMCVAAILGSLAWCGSAPGADARPLSDEEAAAVLGRIIGKSLARAEVNASPIQWAHIRDRGIIYLIQTDLAEVTAPAGPVEKAPSDADIEWENAQRAMRGEPPVARDTPKRSISAVEAVRKTIGEYGDRLALGSSEGIAAILYSGGGMPVTFVQPGGTSPWWRSVEGQDQLPRDDYRVIRLPGSQDTGKKDRYVVIERYVSDASIAPQAAEDRREDVRVLAAVLDKKLRAAFPDEYWGTDMRGRPGALGFWPSRWGPILVLNVTFPVGARTSPTEEKDLDLWEATVRELRGEPTERAARVGGSSIVQSVKETLAEYGWRIRGLQGNDELTVLVFSSSAALSQDPRNAHAKPAWEYQYAIRRAMENIKTARGSEERPVWLELQAFPAADATQAAQYVIHVFAADLMAASDGKIDRGTLFERIRVEEPAPLRTGAPPSEPSESPAAPPGPPSVLPGVKETEKPPEKSPAARP